ncbi:hypothetical protein HOS99_gp054 [Staphylococcus phage phiSA_BS1]|uniref:Uncharacterized protein n=2 Tax=Baoshanvirus TaxID=2732969 RepID=A0A2P1MXJ8_9CAUD|nr:hypothetical protein HOS99_gp054 [Staphylococcus phage phiSA_BS1]YP_009799979.1 hypothetical protein HOT02_gp139 [Staphylococcus phage phiSA_BS2]AVP40307.1 hypothetical protein [Staphylococcus phage phiSA_BS1]AVR55583.1 hypothetical protein phiSABS2_139 [Staphylococcus phage phiSA_BS2]
MKITIKDLFENYDLFRHLKVDKEVMINEREFKTIIEDTIEEAFNKGVIDKDELSEDIYKGIEDTLSDTEVETKVKLGLWSDHDTVDIEVK